MLLTIDRQLEPLQRWELPDADDWCTGAPAPAVPSQHVQQSTTEWHWRTDFAVTDPPLIAVPGGPILRSPTNARFWITFAFDPSIVIGTEGATNQGNTEGVPSRLQERLDYFEFGFIEAEPVSTPTRIALNKLVSWLSNQSDTVSITVSKDGMVSIATVFPNEVRLYIETERDGSSEAAVTRESRYAQDIPVGDIANLTPEAIRAAIGSI